MAEVNPGFGEETSSIQPVGDSVWELRIQDILVCSICSDILTDPRLLPCFHTFCLKCVTELVNNCQFLRPSCPLCRNEFSVPLGGVSTLQKNIYLQAILSDDSESEQESETRNSRENSLRRPRNILLCDVCIDLKKCAWKCRAVWFCGDCEQNLCEFCFQCHKMINKTKVHRLIPAETAPTTYGRINERAKTRFCERHVQKAVELWCKMCKMMACVVCYVSAHSGHQCEVYKEHLSSAGSTEDTHDEERGAVGGSRRNGSHHRHYGDEPAEDRQRFKGYCFFCGWQGHKAFECPDAMSASLAGPMQANPGFIEEYQVNSMLPNGYMHAHAASSMHAQPGYINPRIASSIMANPGYINTTHPVNFLRTNLGYINPHAAANLLQANTGYINAQPSLLQPNPGYIMPSAQGPIRYNGPLVSGPEASSSAGGRSTLETMMLLTTLNSVLHANNNARQQAVRDQHVRENSFREISNRRRQGANRFSSNNRAMLPSLSAPSGFLGAANNSRFLGLNDNAGSSYSAGRFDDNGEEGNFNNNAGRSSVRRYDSDIEGNFNNSARRWDNVEEENFNNNAESSSPRRRDMGGRRDSQNVVASFVKPEVDSGWSSSSEPSSSDEISCDIGLDSSSNLAGDFSEIIYITGSHGSGSLADLSCGSSIMEAGSSGEIICDNGCTGVDSSGDFSHDIGSNEADSSSDFSHVIGSRLININEDDIIDSTSHENCNNSTNGNDAGYSIENCDNACNMADGNEVGSSDIAQQSDNVSTVSSTTANNSTVNNLGEETNTTTWHYVDAIRNTLRSRQSKRSNMIQVGDNPNEDTCSMVVEIGRQQNKTGCNSGRYGRDFQNGAARNGSSNTNNGARNFGSETQYAYNGVFKNNGADNRNGASRSSDAEIKYYQNGTGINISADGRAIQNGATRNIVAGNQNVTARNRVTERRNNQNGAFRNNGTVNHNGALRRNVAEMRDYQNAAPRNISAERKDQNVAARNIGTDSRNGGSRRNIVEMRNNRTAVINPVTSRCCDRTDTVLHCHGCGRVGHESQDCMNRQQCRRCGLYQHSEEDCKNDQRRTLCYQCNVRGHVAQDCPTTESLRCISCNRIGYHTDQCLL